VYGQTGIRPRAVVWGLVVAACLFAAVAGSAVAAQNPNPEPLWNAYPLDGSTGSGGSSQNAATTTARQPAAPAASTNAQSVTVTEKAGDGPPWLLMIAAGAGGALFVVVLLTLQGRRARRREAALTGVTDEWPWLTASSRGASELRAQRSRERPATLTANGVVPDPEAEVARAANETASEWAAEREREVEPAANGTASEWVADAEREPEPAGEAANGAASEWVADAEREREAGEAANGAAAERVAERQREPEPAVGGGAAQPGGGEASAFDVAEVAAVPWRRFEREPANRRPAAARKGPICQVRWSSAGQCFYAVTTDADGVEHRVAWSPPIEWGRHGPPDEESREARAALRVLSKELRDKGWRPMRAKGQDFDEPRWYARRFRLPVAEGEAVSSPRSGSARA
jgi:hypothetical protein